MQVTLRQETKHRPMDLRAHKPNARAMDAESAADAQPVPGPSHDCEVALKIASTIAAEARAAVKVQP